MKNSVRLISLSLLALFLVACKNTSSSDAVNLYLKDGTLVKSIQNAKIVAKVKRTIASREKTYVKILPIYKYYIDININDEKQSWLISTLGYIKRKDSDSSQLYKVNNPKILSKFIQKADALVGQ